ncbi:MAG TPA: SCP2 sterol-binding domain-containing protein [Gammaproteobacteria bacterium]|nr:SCP2 sterol-binding domain-containing protein [Gammaproteobacteria bacterium]
MLLTVVLERALSTYLRWDPETLARVTALAGKVVKMEVTGWNLVFYLCPDSNGISLKNHYAGEVHATIAGSPWALLRMGIATPEEKVRLASSLTITGDVELAQTLSQIVRNSQLDWEEPLSHLTGDVVAHQIGRMVKRVVHWGKEAMSQARQNLGGYLQEELRLLPPRQEIEDFYTDVYLLNNDIERIEARVRRINNG